MANSISGLKAHTSPVYEGKPLDIVLEDQEVTAIAKEMLQNTQSVSEKGSDLTERMLKKHLLGIIEFDKFCEIGKEKGAVFTNDGRFYLEEASKNLVADLEFNHAVIKSLFLNFIRLQGYQYNPISGLLTNGMEDAVDQTQKLLREFSTNEDLMGELKKKVREVSLYTIYKVIDYEVVKDVVKLFMDSNQLIPFLKRRGWVVFGKEKESEIVSPNGKSCYLDNLVTKWKKQKSEIVQSIQFCGYAYNRIDDDFRYYQKIMTIDEVYDCIKDQVVDQLVFEAKVLGFDFDVEKKLFIKEDCEVHVREVMIQVHLKHMGLEDIL